MPTNPKSDLLPQEEIQKPDNLTIIPGVSKALEQWLRESLKVYTFADLAKLSAQKIRARGKQTGEVLSIEELEPILAKAKELADAASAESALPAKAKPEKAAPSAKTIKEWNDFANFVICFEKKTAGGKEEKRTKVEHRTGIQHMETEEQASWPGIETDEACKWMLKRLGQKATTASEEDSPATEALTTETSAASASVSIEIIEIQVLQPPSSNKPQDISALDRTVGGYVNSEAPLSFRIAFRIIGPGASETAKRNLEFNVVFHAVNVSTSAVTRLGASKLDSLKENEFSYSAELAPLTLSPGMYKLKILTAIRDIRPIWAYTEIPSFQVM